MVTIARQTDYDYGNAIHVRAKCSYMTRMQGKDIHPGQLSLFFKENTALGGFELLPSDSALVQEISYKPHACYMYIVHTCN